MHSVQSLSRKQTWQSCEWREIEDTWRKAFLSLLRRTLPKHLLNIDCVFKIWKELVHISMHWGGKVLRTAPRLQQDSLLWFSIKPICLCQWITAPFFFTPVALIAAKPSHLQIPTPSISKQTRVLGIALLGWFGYGDLFERKDKAKSRFVFLLP